MAIIAEPVDTNVEALQGFKQFVQAFSDSAPDNVRQLLG